jgi:hypothetical protein
MRLPELSFRSSYVYTIVEENDEKKLFLLNHETPEPILAEWFRNKQQMVTYASTPASSSLFLPRGHSISSLEPIGQFAIALLISPSVSSGHENLRYSNHFASD